MHRVFVNDVGARRSTTKDRCSSVGLSRVRVAYHIWGLGDLCAMRAKRAPNVRHVKVRCKSDLNLCETQMSANLDFSPLRY